MKEKLFKNTENEIIHNKKEKLQVNVLPGWIYKKSKQEIQQYRILHYDSIEFSLGM